MVEPAEYPEGDSRRGYERFPSVFVIDELRCVFCGFCGEACPCDAVGMDTGMHPAAYDSRDQFIYDKPLLLTMVGRNGSRLTGDARHEPGDATHPGVTRKHNAHSTRLVPRVHRNDGSFDAPDWARASKDPRFAMILTLAPFVFGHRF